MRGWVACGAVVATVALGLGTDEVVRAPSEPGAALHTWRSFAAPPRSLLLAREFAVGREHTYATFLEHAMRQPDGATFTVRLEGEWSLATIAHTEAGVLLRAQLHAGVRSIVRDGNAMPVESRGLDVPYYLTVGPDGRITAVTFDKTVDDATRAALASIAALIQVVGLGSGDATWTTDERDTLGPYHARYTRDAWNLVKQKLGYTLTGVKASVPASSVAIALRSDGWPTSIEGRESIVIAIEKANMTDDAKFKLVRVRGRMGVPIGAMPDGMETVSLDAIDAAAHSSASDDLKLLAGASLEDLLGDVRAAGDDLHASTRAFLRLAALFRIDPDAARRASRDVIAGVIEPKAGSAVIGALGRAGTPEAQRALGDVLSAETANATMRDHAAVAMGLTKQPTRDTVAALVRASQGTGALADTALLAMGTTANHGAASDPDTAGRTVEELLHRLAVATDDNERIRVLRALGNTGDVRVQVALEAAFGAPNDAVRATAVEAMRLLGGPRVDGLLVRALSDRSVEVRTAAVLAATHRSDLTSLASALAQAGRSDADLGVRIAIVTLAAGRLGIPAMRAIVEWTAANEKDARLRESAKQALQPQPT